MNHFFVLLKKELKDMITPQNILPIIIIVVIFALLGQFIGSATESAAKNSQKVAVQDNDQTPASQEMLAKLKAEGFELVTIQPGAQNTVEDAAKEGLNSLLAIEKGFEQDINSGKAPKLSLHSRLTSFSVLAMMGASATQNAAEEIGKILTAKLLAEKGITDTKQIENPITLAEYTHVNDKTAQVSSGAVQAIAMSQTIFVPIIIFMIVILASQMTATAIANEKGDKTLETLLTTPVSRLSVLFAKMTAAGIGSLVMSLVFLIGFSSYMGSLTGSTVSGMPANTPQVTGGDISAAFTTLGLSLNPLQFVIIGIELFTTILIALAVSTMLGAMAEDIKGVQTAVTPIMFCVMIPYLISLFTDISALPMPARVFLYVIPFTHTFTATAEMVFRQYGLITFGVIYQLLCLAVSLYLAVRLFSSDKLFTVKLKKRKNAKANAAE
ncbi:ABC transporter permease [Acetanaerobacterium elongatum]|uniref:ABC-2 type transport system permease protein n=1 Tax=Acetanaerobacterium elongatum TaxID=258515 RepID=A0A1H0D6R4_9FIRM|nr:ABC transporter permease [Acetanaerobacterium elongatum]SDN65862.1 ABC-2 type transport system permease protein [Acetanaerobacterium elongatum]